MSEVKPALTPEEWRDGEPSGVMNWYIDHEIGVVDCSGLETGHMHALAAMLLNGQPFGYTWEDVDLLRSIANAAESDHDKSGEFADWERQRQAESLADRIASLLPPREETE